jgi:hypothetical protein
MDSGFGMMVDDTFLYEPSHSHIVREKILHSDKIPEYNQYNSFLLQLYQLGDKLQILLHSSLLCKENASATNQAVAGSGQGTNGVGLGMTAQVSQSTP